MKINPHSQIHHSYKQTTEQVKQQQKPKAEKQDQVEISQAAKEMQHSGIDETRKAKMDALQKQIDAGEYRVDERAVANRFYQFWNERG
ncbi:flagellar biosynthesis anti-sigma factor FlgM [Salicibibacter cibi]|uniref:Negative regulator of flagellin synthesis n=1 Tax=Salicibibacter cibi TaxID=2743001 RepID=A0A7T6ZE32_9BACI|nr:flagellar biosynthesis anti-sigma factor FlgM [Salicibibacter cibi]QQK81582.1 flagellar biosynthesis anti-sigma factor FlgM [Salicibibacter cibi]